MAQRILEALMNSRLYPAPLSNNPQKIVGHCDGCQSLHVLRTADIAMYTDGACLNNGGPNAQAGIGVYCACDPDLCVSKRLLGQPQTSQRAEIHGAIEAMKQARRFKHEGIFEAYRGLVIITDSAYLVNGISEWVHKGIGTVGGPRVVKEWRTWMTGRS